MSTNDYIKFVTEQFVKYMDKPKSVRKKDRKKRRKSEPLLTKWFGIIPFSIELFVKRKKK
ncbi:YqzE family protein [Bacillus carboniphilus]|uniref:YqzE family protein n=1 Tax=Bacillus carboniphilus TaxID=86663 RepID=A0ABY9JX02_9BACI|nr:YqzE family protein [Bacillus carboniphilus]WLR43916.1 YqzE family protein [Bacillus carboniphilus]